MPLVATNTRILIYTANSIVSLPCAPWSKSKLIVTGLNFLACKRDGVGQWFACSQNRYKNHEYFPPRTVSFSAFHKSAYSCFQLAFTGLSDNLGKLHVVPTISWLNSTYSKQFADSNLHGITK